LSSSISPAGVERSGALGRMGEALEAAKRARDAGHDVHQVREMLRAAQSAFQAGDYPTATRVADQVLDICSALPVRSPGQPSKAETLDRMIQALEASKQSRDSGNNVKQLRAMLKTARSAFEAGDYTTAMRVADQILEICRAQSAPSARGPPRSVVRRRINEAHRAMKKRRRRGFSIDQSTELLRRARAAFEGGDFLSAMDLANQALELSGSG